MIRLGKQARDDGASDSDNVLGDVVEALIGALFSTAGSRRRDALHPPRLGAASSTARPARPQHPKSALQEWAAARGRKPPDLRAGRPHRRRTTRRASPSASSIRASARPSAEGSSKQEAETAAASALLEQLQ